MGDDDEGDEMTYCRDNNEPMMHRMPILVLSLSALISSCASFQRATFPRLIDTVITALMASEVSAVSICTAELCTSCQAEGFGAEGILKDLISRDLPYPVDEAPSMPWSLW
jgi:hypothetical protein